MTRKSTTDIDQLIDLVKSTASRAGLTYINYGRSTFDTLRRYSFNGTHALIASPEGTTGGSDIGYARGLNEMYHQLQGMYLVLDSMTRHNSDTLKEKN